MINLSDRDNQPLDYVADASLFVTLFFETARAAVFRIARRCSPPSDSSPISPGPHAAPRPPNPFPGVVRHQRRGTIAGRVLLWIDSPEQAVGFVIQTGAEEQSAR